MPADPGGTGGIAPAVGLYALATDFWVSRALHVAVKLGVVDLLAKGPKSVDFIAAQSGANADALFRLMRVLAAHNIFVEGAIRANDKLEPSGGNAICDLADLGNVASDQLATPLTNASINSRRLIRSPGRQATVSKTAL